MSIPTHNLYDFVHQATKRRFWLMYFSPWGSRELENLIDHQVDDEFLNGSNGIPVENRFNFQKLNISISPKDFNQFLIKRTQPIVFCHDQEPLNFKLYNAESDLICNYSIASSVFNNFSLKKRAPYNIYKKSILLHSELNSTELQRFENTDLFVGAYWWSHAIIAQDWYRFAKHDMSLLHKVPRKKLFLTYCRRIDDTNIYRQEFLSMLSALSLNESCLINRNSFNTVSSDLSAEYHSEDFLNTAISVVLETTFDSRIHLTEKTLRPIACGHPFIIANGPGCLKLLRKYGFKTFSPYINESYDDIINDSERLATIAHEMKRLQQLPEDQLNMILNCCKSIAEHNKKLFFSDNFLNQVTEELSQNVNNAFDKCQNSYQIEPWLNAIKIRRELKKAQQPVKKDIQRLIMYRLVKKLKRLISNDNR